MGAQKKILHYLQQKILTKRRWLIRIMGKRVLSKGGDNIISGDSTRMKIFAPGADIILFWKYICIEC